MSALESPAWHEDELRDASARLELGKSKFIDWEKAKLTFAAKFWKWTKLWLCRP